MNALVLDWLSLQWKRNYLALEKNIGDWFKLVATSLWLLKLWEKPVKVVKGRILAGWAQKSPERESGDTHTCWWQWTGKARSLLPTTSRCGQGIRPLGTPWQKEEPLVIEGIISFQNLLSHVRDFPRPTQSHPIGCNVVTHVHVTAYKTNNTKNSYKKEGNSPTCCGPVIWSRYGHATRLEKGRSGWWAMGKAKLGSSAWQGIQHGKQDGADKRGRRGRPRSVLAPPRPQQGPLYPPTPCSCHPGPTYYTGTCFFFLPHQQP